eukprot:3164065-Prymnesium_polylepis.1
MACWKQPRWYLAHGDAASHRWFGGDSVAPPEPVWLPVHHRLIRCAGSHGRPRVVPDFAHWQVVRFDAVVGPAGVVNHEHLAERERAQNSPHLAALSARARRHALRAHLRAAVKEPAASYPHHKVTLSKGCRPPLQA